jgi:hypothetical protein
MEKLILMKVSSRNMKRRDKMQIAQKHLFSRQPLSIFGNITVTCLLIGTVLLTGIKLGVGRGGGPPFPITLSMLLGAVIIVSGIRWTPLIGTVLFIVYLIAYYEQPFVAYHLMHPKEEFGFFALMLVLVVLPMLGLVASITACVQNYSPGERATPRWFTSLCMGFAGVIIGALLIGAIMPANPVSAVTQTTYTNGVPTVHMSIGSFEQSHRQRLKALAGR